MSRDVAGYEARSGGGVGVVSGVDVGVGFGVDGVGVAVGDDVGVGLTVANVFEPFIFFGGSLLATLPDFI